MSSAAEDIWEKSLNSSDLQKERHREVVFETITENQNLWSSMVLKDEAGNGDGTESYYKIPLGEVSPETNGTGSIQKNIMVPLLPYNYTTIDNDKFEALPVRKGWIYIFKNDYLWREMEVVERSRLRDVNLTNYQNMSRRLATIECDSRVVVPHKINGREQKIEVCFSEEQWGWNYINIMGGMDPEDPRLKDYTRMPVGKQVSDSKSRRKKRMQRIENLKDYVNSFSSSPTSYDIANLDKLKNSAHRKLNVPSNLGALFLFDPLGIAESLKVMHIALIRQIEIMSEIMSQSDYPLAALIKPLIDSEFENVTKDEKIKKEMNKRLSGTDLRIATRGGDSRIARWNFLSMGEQKKYVRDHQKKYMEEIEDFTPIRKVINIDKLEKSKKEWDNNDNRLSKELEQLEDDLVKYLDDASQPVTFETAMLDYLDGTSVNFVKGVGRISFFIDSLSKVSGLKYLKKIADKKNKIGKILCDENYVKKHQQFIMAAELEDFSDLALIDDGYKLDATTILDLSKKAVKGLSRFMEGMIKLKIPDGKGGLKWLTKLVNAYLGSSINIAVHSAELKALYRPEKVFKSHIYSYLPSLDEKLAKTKISYLRIGDSSNKKTVGIAIDDLKFIKENAEGAILPFRSLQLLVYLINLGVLVHSISSSEPKTAKEKLSVAYSVTEIIKVFTEITGALVKHKAGIYKSAAKSASASAKTLVPATRLLISTQNLKGRAKWKAINVAQSNASLFLQAEKDGLKYAASLNSWANIVNVATTTLTVLSSVIIVAMGMIDYSKSDTIHGKVGAVFKMVGGNMMLVSFSHVRWVLTVVRTGASAAAGTSMMAAGAATAEFGIGIIIFIIGALIAIAGEIFLREANRPALIKALDYCYFGKNSYSKSIFSDNPYKYNRGTFSYMYKFNFVN
ncbi:hypothetical protein MNBD_GAMMA21-2118, partial [hydrothermal vent metagenome]